MVFIFLALPLSINCFSQTEFNYQFKFQEGIYLNLDQLAENKPEIPLSPEIEVHIGNNMISQKIKNDLPEAKINDELRKLTIDDLWAISINGVPLKVTSSEDMIMLQDGLYQVPKIYYLYKFSFLGNVTLYHKMLRKNTTKTMFKKRLTEDFIVKYNDSSKAWKLNVKNISKAIADDIELSKEFNSDKKRKKDLYQYILEYNARNPVYMK